VRSPIHATEWSGTTVERMGAAHCTAMNASNARRRDGVPNSRVRGIKGQRRRFRWRPLKREWRCTKERSGGDYSKRTYSFHDRYSFTTRPRLFHNRKLSRRIFDISQRVPQCARRSRCSQTRVGCVSSVNHPCGSVSAATQIDGGTKKLGALPPK
jgi:hypothetical protein